MTRSSDAVRLQEQIAKQVIDADDFGDLNNICAVDVAYDDRTAYCSAVIMSRSGEAVETADSASPIEYPYVPGLLMLREAQPIIQTLKRLENDYDLLLVDGHGRLHPRRCGIACYLGVILDKPAIGVAKSLLCGSVRTDGSIELGGKILGHALGSGRKRLYVSTGHRISLGTAVSLVKELGKGAMPDVVKQADARSKYQKKKRGLLGLD